MVGGKSDKKGGFAPYTGVIVAMELFAAAIEAESGEPSQVKDKRVWRQRRFFAAEVGRAAAVNEGKYCRDAVNAVGCCSRGGLCCNGSLDNRTKRAKKADFVRHTGVKSATGGCAVAVEGERSHSSKKCKVESKK